METANSVTHSEKKLQNQKHICWKTTEKEHKTLQLKDQQILLCVSFQIWIMEYEVDHRRVEWFATKTSSDKPQKTNWSW